MLLVDPCSLHLQAVHMLFLFLSCSTQKAEALMEKLSKHNDEKDQTECGTVSKQDMDQNNTTSAIIHEGEKQ